MKRKAIGVNIKIRKFNNLIKNIRFWLRFEPSLAKQKIVIIK